MATAQSSQPVAEDLHIDLNLTISAHIKEALVRLL